MSVGLCDGVLIVPDTDWTGLLMARHPHSSNVPLKLGVVPKLSDLFWRFTRLNTRWKHKCAQTRSERSYWNFNLWDSPQRNQSTMQDSDAQRLQFEP
jgi:hypothetical protein